MQDLISPPLQQPEITKKKKSPMIIVVAIVVIVLIAGFFILRPFQNSSQTEITPTPAEEPSPTEKPQIVKDKVRIQVVNGTGTPGQAGTALEALTEAGYNKDLIKTDNAEEYGTTPTTISARAGFEDVANDIKAGSSTYSGWSCSIFFGVICF